MHNRTALEGHSQDQSGRDLRVVYINNNRIIQQNLKTEYGGKEKNEFGIY